MKTRPAVDDDEIRSFMDFDALLLQHDSRLRRERIVRNTRTMWLAIAFVLTIGGLTIVLRSQRTESALEKKQVTVPQSATPENIAEDNNLRKAPDSLMKKDPTSLSPVEKQPGVQRSRSTPVKPGPKATAPSPRSEPVYVQAEPIHGYPSLYEYFDSNLVYPRDAVKDSVEGTVNVEFVIDMKGNAVDIRVDNSLGSAFDTEAIRLVENMPVWKPATYNGQPVRSKISLPITFGLQKARND